MYDDMLSLLDNADPETLRLMLQAVSGNELGGVGHEFMGAQQPEGRNVGHTYVASSPLEHAAAAAKNMLGAYMMRTGQGQRGTGIEAYIRALRSGRSQINPLQPGYDAMAGAQYASPYGSGD
jgi:hypothetical protein